MRIRKSYIEWGILAFQLLLVGLIAYFLIRAVIGFTNPESNWQPVSTGGGVLPSQNSTAAANLDLSFDPFHRTQTIAVELPEDLGSDAPETSLDLTLVGRITGEPATATLEIPDGSQKSYQIGEEILNGVTLESVHPDYVVISQNGKLERLTFGESVATGLQASIEALRNAPQIDARTLLRSVSLSPAMTDDGEPRGMRISALDGKIKLEDFGLQSGDILTHIGTMDLRSGRPNFRDMQQELRNANSAQIKLLRNGQPMTVEIKL